MTDNTSSKIKERHDFCLKEVIQVLTKRVRLAPGQILPSIEEIDQPLDPTEVGPTIVEDPNVQQGQQD